MMDLIDQLEYNPDTGEFKWKVNKGKVKAGDLAGTIDASGYLVIKFNYVRYYGHRLAIYFMTGKWPKNDVDHKNKIKSDNRWVNLRDATTSQNMSNRVIQNNNTSGFMGVQIIGSKFRAYAKKDGKAFHIGNYNTAEEAAKARDKIVFSLFGDFASLNFERENYVY